MALVGIQIRMIHNIAHIYGRSATVAEISDTEDTEEDVPEAVKKVKKVLKK